MKKKLFLAKFALCCLLLTTFQQLSAQNPLNAQLRELFSGLQPPMEEPASGLYDMAAQFSDSTLWTDFSNDSSNATNWAMLYDDMRNMLYDTTQLEPTDSVFMNALRFKGDTILLGLLNFDYNKFVDSAFTSEDTIYFYEDSLTETLADYPGRLAEPYVRKEIFAFSPLEEKAPSDHVTFRIDPNFIFMDDFNLLEMATNPYELQINLQDGNGWQSVDPNVITHYSVQYTSGPSTRLIKARVFNHANGTVKKKSKSTLKVLITGTPTIPPSYEIRLPGIDVGVYPPCEDSPQETRDKKYVIYAEGFDMFENHSIQDIYRGIQNTELAELRNHGYTILAVNWWNSARDMRDNAESLIGLINHLKCQLASGLNDIDTVQPFVVVGESMGGVIARYALTKMENQVAPGSCLPNMYHNTRLYISIDAPHQGANVPMAFQELYRDLLGPLYLLPVNIKVKGIWIRNYLNNTAARQLLKHHILMNLPFLASYYPHWDRNNFMNDMRALDNGDGYPDFVKKMAITDGLLTGEHQIDITNTGTLNAGDHFLDADATITKRILGIRVIGTTGAVELNAIPSIGGVIYDRNITLNHWGVSIKWKTKKIGRCPFCIKIRIPTGFNVGFVGSTISAFTGINGNMPLLDHRPGGRTTLDDQLNRNHLSDQFDFLNWSVSSFRVPGTRITIPGFRLLRVSFNWNIFTDGLSFNFIPVQSALDYSGSSNKWDHNIFAENINTKLSRTPFDVIMGEFNGLGGYPNNNGPINAEHTDIRNNRAPNNLANGRGQFLINREIGEEELWLDNWTTLPSLVPLLESEFEITGGDRVNPYYEYPGQLASTVFYLQHPSAANNGVFAKGNPLTFLGHGILKTDNAVNDWGIVGPYTWWNQPQIVCNVNFRKIVRDEPEDAAMVPDIKVYPNPTAGQFTIQLDESFVRPQISIINSSGQMIHQLPMDNNRTAIGKDLGLTKGLYLIRIIDEGKAPQLRRLLIQ